jgi:GH15 family glucan-1,4-alpha-glucosidase
MRVPRSARYPPLEDYGIIGDSRTCALVSLDGSVDWLCLPDFDSASMFARILDWQRGGYFQIAPDIPYEARRSYVQDTNVLETVFLTEQGEVVLTDFMPALTEEEKREVLSPLRSLLRFVECRSGRVPMRLECVPRPDYGREHVHLRGHSRFQVTFSRGRQAVHFRSDVPLDLTHIDARATFEAIPGERLHFSLAYSNSDPAVLLSNAYVDRVYEQTLAFWRRWSAQATYEGPYREQVLRSALALKLMVFAPSGAIIAAPTTSLPEAIGGDRNWDYRYCWLRDAAFIVRALLGVGMHREAGAFAGWLLHATNLTAPKLDPLYTIYGEFRVPEKELPYLEGYRRSQPVRIGNGAYTQHQLDVYGELIDAVHSYFAATEEKMSKDDAKFVSGVANYVADIWREPDAGIWEARAEPAHYTQSKVLAWDALRHAVQLREEGRIRGDSERWRREAELIREQVLKLGYNQEVGAFTQVYGGETLDAAVLTLPLVGFIDASDPRMLSTIDAVRRELEHKGFVWRYKNFDDGLVSEEAGFLVCNFWLAAALAQAGRLNEARECFEQTVKCVNDLGLMAEEYDPDAGILLGNFPQGLSHIGLIVAALEIQAAEQGAKPGRKAFGLIQPGD